MNKFVYKALGHDNKIYKDIFHAENLKSAKKGLIQKGVNLLEIYSPEKTTTSKNSSKINFSNNWRLFITEELAEMLDSQVPLIRALKVLIKQTKDINKKIILKGIYNNICNGLSFYDSLNEYPNIFNEFYIQSVKAGELSGTLEKTLIRLSEYYKYQKALKQKIIGALAYPLFLLIMAITSMLIISTFVIPKLSPLFAEMNSELPNITMFTIALNNIFINNLSLFTLFFIVCFTLMIIARKLIVNSIYIILRKLPLSRAIIDDIFTANLFRILHSLIENGVELPQALKIIQNTDSYYSIQLRNVLESLKNGNTFTKAVVDEGMIEEKAMIILSIAEESGNLEKSFYKLSEIYSAKLNRKIAAITKSIGPVFIIIMATVIGFVIISLMLPIITMNVSI